jgi:hypothetical protein
MMDVTVLEVEKLQSVIPLSNEPYRKGTMRMTEFVMLRVGFRNECMCVYLDAQPRLSLELVYIVSFCLYINDCNEAFFILKCGISLDFFFY